MNAEPSETSYISLQGNWVRYADFDLSGITELTASVATGTTGKLEFRVGSPTGAKIAEVSTAGTSSQWRTFKDYTSAVTGSYGIVDLYIVGTGDHGGIIDYVDFNGPASSVAVTQNFDEWVADMSWNSVPVSQRNRNDDPDGDGFSNRLERALGMNPTLSDTPAGYSLKTERATSGQMQVTLRYQKHAANETYELVHSPNLEESSWSTVNTSGEQFDSATGGYIQTWDPDMNQPKGFVRMRLIETP